MSPRSRCEERFPTEAVEMGDPSMSERERRRQGIRERGAGNELRLTEAAMRAWVEKHGVACGWYTGRKNVSTVEREPTREEQPSGEEPAECLWKDVQEVWETNATSLSAPWGRVEWKGGFFQEDRALQSTATDE